MLAENWELRGITLIPRILPNIPLPLVSELEDSSRMSSGILSSADCFTASLVPDAFSKRPRFFCSVLAEGSVAILYYVSART